MSTSVGLRLTLVVKGEARSETLRSRLGDVSCYRIVSVGEVDCDAIFVSLMAGAGLGAKVLTGRSQILSAKGHTSDPRIRYVVVGPTWPIDGGPSAPVDVAREALRAVLVAILDFNSGSADPIRNICIDYDWFVPKELGPEKFAEVARSTAVELGINS